MMILALNVNKYMILALNVSNLQNITAVVTVMLPIISVQSLLC